MWRELLEEAALSRDDFKSITSYPGWVGYNYDQQTIDTLQKQNITNIGQVQRWWFLEIKDNVPINLDRAADREFDGYQWFESDKVVDLIAPFKREMYRQLIDYFQDHIQ